MSDTGQHSAFVVSQSRVVGDLKINPGAASKVSSTRADRLDSAAASYAQLDPNFIVELDTLNMTIDEYEQMLVDNHSLIITTDNTVG